MKPISNFLELEAHEAAGLIPAMTEEEYLALKADIAANGQLEPILLLDDQILDGRHRYRACMELGVEPIVEPLVGDIDSPLAHVLSLNLHRRHLSESQRAMVAVAVKKLREPEAKERQRRKPKSVPANWQEQNGRQESADEAAAMLNVGPRSVYRAEAVLDHGSEELIEAVKRGEVAVSKAAKIAVSVAKPKQMAAVQAKPEEPSKPPKTKARVFYEAINEAVPVLSTIREDYGDGATMLASKEWKSFPRSDVTFFVLAVRDVAASLVQLKKELKDYVTKNP
jgi:ParB-like chromosome segregation protein Spo0J